MDSEDRTIAPRPSWAVLPAEPADGASKTILDYLVRRFPRIGEPVWRDRFERGLVIDSDRRPLPVDAPYRPHLRVGYFRELRGEIRIPLKEEVLFRSEQLLVVDKPPFLPVSPSGRFVDECLLYRIERRLGLRGVGPIHRLDRMTSGLVMLSDRPEARSAYGRLLQDGGVEKTYEALCRAPERPDWRRRTVRSWIEPGEPFFRMRSLPAGGPDGRTNAETEAELLAWSDGVAHLRLRPITGKTHQLRLHAADLGCPILRDPLYPALQPERPDDYAAPMALLAKQLAFVDPFSGESVRFLSHQALE